MAEEQHKSNQSQDHACFSGRSFCQTARELLMRTTPLKPCASQPPLQMTCFLQNRKAHGPQTNTPGGAETQKLRACRQPPRNRDTRRIPRHAAAAFQQQNPRQPEASRAQSSRVDLELSAKAHAALRSTQTRWACEPLISSATVLPLSYRIVPFSMIFATNQKSRMHAAKSHFDTLLLAKKLPSLREKQRALKHRL